MNPQDFLVGTHNFNVWKADEREFIAKSRIKPEDMEK